MRIDSIQLRNNLANLLTFSEREIRPHVNAASEDIRIHAVCATFLRIHANVVTLVSLFHPVHFQAISMVARSILELAVDLVLIRKRPDGPELVAAYTRYERLRWARNTVKHCEKTGATIGGVDRHREFIDRHGGEIDEQTERFWPGLKGSLRHWTGLPLGQRCAAAGEPFRELYASKYAHLSWFAHSGLAGISGIAPEGFPVLRDHAYGVADRSFQAALEMMIQELGREQSALPRKLEMAGVLAFADDPDFADEILRELVREDPIAGSPKSRERRSESSFSDD